MNKNASKYCAPSRWEHIAREEALSASIDPVRLMSGARTRPYVEARWRAWRRLKAMGHSYKSIANASGFDHSTVMHGIKFENPAKTEKPACTDDVAPVDNWAPCLASNEIGVFGNRPSHGKAA